MTVEWVWGVFIPWRYLFTKYNLYAVRDVQLLMWTQRARVSCVFCCNFFLGGGGTDRTKNIYNFWNDSKAKSKDSGRARCVFSFRDNAYACNLTGCCSHSVRSICEHGGGAKDWRIWQKEQFKRARLGVMNRTCGFRACNTHEPQFWDHHLCVSRRFLIFRCPYFVDGCTLPRDVTV